MLVQLPVDKGTDIDQPRTLAKNVTVESTKEWAPVGRHPLRPTATKAHVRLVPCFLGMLTGPRHRCLAMCALNGLLRGIGKWQRTGPVEHQCRQQNFKYLQIDRYLITTAAAIGAPIRSGAVGGDGAGDNISLRIA